MLKPIFKTLLSTLIVSAMLTACGGASLQPTTVPASVATAVPTQAAVMAATVAPAPTSAPAPTVAPSPTTAAAAATVAPALPVGDAKDIIIAAMRKQFTSGPYRTKATITSDSRTIELVAEIIPPDKMHSVNQIGKTAIENIFIGDKSWSKVGTTAWKESPGAGITDVLAQIDGSMIDDIANTFSDAKLIGPDVLDGTPTLVYSFVSDSNKLKTPIDVKSNVKVWIGVANGLVLKQEIDGMALGKKSLTVQLLEYDAGIAIEPPVK